MKWLRWVIILVVFIALVCTIAVAYHNIKTNDDFWTMSVGQALTILVAITITFWATQVRHDERKAKEHAETIINKIQQIIADERLFVINSKLDESGKKELQLLKRRLGNCVDRTKGYGKQLGFEKEADYIDSQFKEYRTLLDEHWEDFEYLAKSETSLTKLIDNIDSKCDQILLALYLGNSRKK